MTEKEWKDLVKWLEHFCKTQEIAGYEDVNYSCYEMGDITICITGSICDKSDGIIFYHRTPEQIKRIIVNGFENNEVNDEDTDF